MAKLVIDLSGRAGLAPKHQGDVNDSTGAPSLRYLGTDGQMAQGIYNPFRFYGYMSPATNSHVTFTEADATDSFSNQLRATVYDSTSQTFYLAENGNNIWYSDFSGPFALDSCFAGSGISGATFTDLEVYQVNGTRKLFYAYAKSGGGNIGIATLPFAANNNTWLSATAASGFNTGATNDVFMMPADNGFMYVADGNALHKIDGTANGGANGTATGNVLLFPSDFKLVDGFDWRGNLWLAMQSVAPVGAAGTSSHNERITGVYVWDRQSTQVRMRDFVPIPGIKEIRKIYVAPNGDVRAIVISSDRFTQIRRFNGTTFEIVEELGISAYPVYRDSVTLMGGLVVWLGADGTWYGHGSIMPGEKEALYQLGSVAGTVGTITSTGAILLLDANFSTTTTRSGVMWGAKGAATHVKMWFPHGQGSPESTTMNGHAGDVYSLVKYLPKLSTVDDLVIVGRPTTSANGTTEATVSVYYNQSTTAAKVFTVTDTLMNKGYIHIPLGKPYVNSVQLKISFATGTTLGVNDFTPAYAVVNYTPTDTFK